MYVTFLNYFPTDILMPAINERHELRVHNMNCAVYGCLQRDPVTEKKNKHIQGNGEIA